MGLISKGCRCNETAVHPVGPVLRDWPALMEISIEADGHQLQWLVPRDSDLKMATADPQAFPCN
ncbi:MAG: hypothetical protein IPF44_09705 [Betaproteobacteria bacterium]|nr:hypothetical protein [Betaproteobacteria bacterium]